MINSDPELEEFLITEGEWIYYETISNILAPFEEATFWILDYC